MDASPAELQAAQLRWNAQGHDGTVPAEDLPRLLGEIREREEAIEQEALKMMIRATSESRWYPRRHMRFAVLVLCGIGALVLAVGGLISLARWLGF